MPQSHQCLAKYLDRGFISLAMCLSDLLPEMVRVFSQRLSKIGKKAEALHGAAAQLADAGPIYSLHLLKRDWESMGADRFYTAEEVENWADAINAIRIAVSCAGFQTLAPDDIKAYNAQIVRDSNRTPIESLSPYRVHNVRVAGYSLPPWQECESSVLELCIALNSMPKALESKEAWAESFIKATLAHLELIRIHPFADGNGRTARLLEFRLLLGGGWPDVTAHLLSNHYNTARKPYYNSIERALTQPEGLREFIEYAIDGFDKQLDCQFATLANLSNLSGHQSEVTQNSINAQASC